MSGKKAGIITLAEIQKRLPKDQIKQFEEFKLKCSKYQMEAIKYPEKLPRIDWSHYRLQVPKTAVPIIDQFEVQYIELNKAFHVRDKLDLTRYFKNWEKLMDDCKQDVDTFKKLSNERIKAYEDELNRIKSIKPIENMTIEEFVILRSDIADSVPCQSRPIFWPPGDDETPIITKADVNNKKMAQQQPQIDSKSKNQEKSENLQESKEIEKEKDDSKKSSKDETSKGTDEPKKP